MKTIDLRVLVHTCQTAFPILARKNFISGERYQLVDEKRGEYRLLPRKCRCKRRVTLAHMLQLLDDGDAVPLYKVKKRKIEEQENEIWMAQSLQVPRVDVITSVDIQRAYDDERQDAIDYIEEVHRLYMENRKELFVPYVEDDFYNQRLLFPFQKDERTEGGYERKELQ